MFSVTVYRDLDTRNSKLKVAGAYDRTEIWFSSISSYQLVYACGLLPRTEIKVS